MVSPATSEELKKLLRPWAGKYVPQPSTMSENVRQSPYSLAILALTLVCSIGLVLWRLSIGDYPAFLLLLVAIVFSGFIAYIMIVKSVRNWRAFERCYLMAAETSKVFVLHPFMEELWQMAFAHHGCIVNPRAATFDDALRERIEANFAGFMTFNNRLIGRVLLDERRYVITDEALRHEITDFMVIESKRWIIANPQVVQRLCVR